MDSAARVDRLHVDEVWRVLTIHRSIDQEPDLSNTATLSSKFQISIPKAVRDELHWEAGQAFVFIPKDKGVLVMPVPELKALAGVKPFLEAVPIAELDDVAIIEADLEAIAALGALRHGLRPCDGSGLQGLGVRPRRSIMNGDDNLLAGRVDAVVSIQRREQAGGVHHACSRKPSEAVLPGGGELTMVERALE
jgi:AbrB family looped-hinge helix DNA binding protein